jgi:2TM family of unknown function (DUF5676)
MAKLHPWVIGSTAALTVAILYSVCAASYALFPDGTIAFANAWFHGFDLNLLKSTKPFTLATFIYVLLGVASTAFVTGALYSCIYNLLRYSRQYHEPRHGRLAH